MSEVDRPLTAACCGVVAPRLLRQRGKTFGLRPSPSGPWPDIRPPASTLRLLAGDWYIFLQHILCERIGGAAVGGTANSLNERLHPQ